MRDILGMESIRSTRRDEEDSDAPLLARSEVRIFCNRAVALRTPGHAVAGGNDHLH